jgi:hypothetical protein
MRAARADCAGEVPFLARAAMLAPPSNPLSGEHRYAQH